MDSVAASDDTSNDTSNVSSDSSQNIPSNVSSNDTSNDLSNDSSNTSQNIPSSVSSNDNSNDTSNDTSNVTTNGPSNDSANDSSNESQYVTQNVSQHDSQTIARVLSNRRQRLLAALRASMRDAPEPSFPLPYDGPGADCTEAMRVFPCCGACFVDMDEPEIGGDQPETLITFLYGSKDQLSYVGHIGPFSSFFRSGSSYIVESAYTIVDGKWCLYHTHPPWRTRPSIQRESWAFDIVPRYSAIAYHHDCYATFLHACPLSPELARERLWLASMARYPGPRPYYYKVTSPTVYDMAEVAIREVARAYGLPELAACPTELVHLIHEYSSPSVLLWRAILTYTLALQLALLPEQPFTEIPLVDIVKWKRGDLLVPSDREQVSTIDDAKSVMRITLDNRGIKEIKRLSRHPSFTETWFVGHGFIVERLSKLREFTACVKDGLLRLRFPESSNGELPMWDTPDPPSPDQTEHLISLGFGLRFFRRYPSHKGITMCHTLDLKLVTGLTFIFNHNGDLLKTFAHFSGYTGHYNPLVFEEHRVEGFSYLPIASGDQIVYIGVIPPENNRIFVRMRLSGDIVINMMTRDSMSTRKPPVFWSKKNPKGLVYGHGCKFHEKGFVFATVHDLANPGATGFESHNAGGPNKHRVRPFHYPIVPRSPNAFHYPSVPIRNGNAPLRGIMSYSPLSGVTEARVYYFDDGSGSGETCRGIIFRYRNGGCRAVGHIWRLRSRVYRDPTHFCVDYGRKDMKVYFLLESDADKSEGYRHTEQDSTSCSNCRPMRGTIFAYTRYDDSKKMTGLHIEVTDEEIYPSTASVEGNDF